MGRISLLRLRDAKYASCRRENDRNREQASHRAPPRYVAANLWANRSTFAYHALPSARPQRGTYNERLHVAKRVEGKVALIVGAGCVGPGWGKGRAAAVWFAGEGAKVFAVDKTADSMAETMARVGNDAEIATHIC